MKRLRKFAKAIDDSTAERRLFYSSNDSSDSTDIEGPHILSEGKDPIVDIIFIHGLRGHPFKTWSVGAVCWPRDFLGQHIENARIITWGYDSSFVNATKLASQDTIVGHAKSLLSDLSFLRDDKSRAIVFVGHSLGGLVIKQALMDSASYGGHGRLPKLAEIYKNTKGVVFLGTPHRGSDKASLASIIGNVGALVLRQPNKQLLESLQPNSGTLEGLRDGFTTISQNMRIICVREERPTPIGIIVPATSATIDGYSVEQISVPEDHMGMARYATRLKIGYKRICSVLEELVDDEAGILNSARATWITGVLNLLYYPMIGDREAGIAETYGETFSWTLEDDGFDRLARMRPAADDEISKSKVDSSFVSWLVGDSDQLFWLSGKAASGKSTLMKYIYNDKRTKKKLRKWAGGNDPILAAFFFFERGDSLQKSREGLLRSLLYQILSQRRELISLIYDSNKEDRRAPIPLPQITWLALKEAFTRLLDCIPESTKVCLFVDGLDEYRMIDREKEYGTDELHLLSYGTNDDFRDYPEGSWIRDGHQEIATIFQNIKTPNVKICVASRELAPFEAAFASAPRLRIHEFTKKDIHHYVYSRLIGEGRQQFYDADEMKEIADTVVKHAEGVFLWVRLVVEELRRGQDDGDRIEDLWTKLMKLPKTLGGKNGLYMRMVDMSPSRDEAINLFRLTLHHKFPPDLDVLFYAAEELYERDRSIKKIFVDQEVRGCSAEILSDRPLRAVKQEVKFLTAEQSQRNLNQLERRLKSRCMGLLEVPRWSRKVQFMHQTAKEFIYQQLRSMQAEDKLLSALSLQFMSAYILKMKRYNLAMGSQDTSGQNQVWSTFEYWFSRLLSFAKDVEVFSGHQNGSYFQLMEEVRKLCETPGQTQDERAINHCFETDLQIKSSPKGFSPWDFLSILVKQNLESYFRMTLERNGIDRDNGVKLMIELIKHCHSWTVMITDRPPLQFMEILFSRGVDMHRRIGKSAFAMSAWETLLHFAVRNLGEHERAYIEGVYVSSYITELMTLMYKLDSNIKGHNRVRFLTSAGMKMDDVAPIWEGTLLEFSREALRSHFSTEDKGGLIASLEQDSVLVGVYGYQAGPFPDLPLPPSWKIDAQVS